MKSGMRSSSTTTTTVRADVPWQVEQHKHGGDEQQHLGDVLLGPRRRHVATGRSHFYGTGKY